MKLKGISAVEQHFEKAVVGGVGLVFLGVLAMQFLTQPNMVTIGRNQPVPPGEAYRPVEEAARALQGRLDSAAGKNLIPEEPKSNLLDQYKQKIAAGVTPRTQFAMLGPAVNLGDPGASTRGSTSGAPIAMSPLPAPTSPAVYAYAATVDPMETIRNKEIKAVLPAEQPYDKQWVTVEATFDGAALKAALAADPDDAGPARPIPNGWYDNSLEIIGVQLERQKFNRDSVSAAMNGQLDTADESWSEPTLVPPMPGTVDVVSELVTNVKSMTDLASALSRARENSDDLLRPAFYPTIAGPKWLPPTEARQLEAAAGGKNPVDVLNDSIAAEERRLAAIERQLGVDPNSSRRPTRDGDGSKGGGGHSAGGPGNQRTSSSSSQNAAARKQQQLEKQRDAINKKIADLQKQIDAIQNGAASSESERRDRKPLLTDPAVRLWAHDATAEPGAAYRYRTRVILNNPVFGRTGLGDESLAKNPIIAGEWSAWTDPVLVLPREVYFVSSATAHSQIGGSVSAGAECFVFYYGFYRRAGATLEPGDVIRTVAKTPPNLMVYDETKLTEGQSPNSPFTSRPDGDSRAPVVAPPDSKSGTPGTTPATGTGKEGQEVVDDMGGLLKPAKKEIPIFIRDIFLDAADIPEITVAKAGGGAAKADESAIFRSAAGHLIARLPAIEKASSLYKQISISAEQGRTQGQPKPEEKKPEIVPQRREDSHGGGEGGGGGGG
ncbi:MAG: hypothetical protein IT435_17185 [Phycisphaerales bacterium]|nr:hypothetical protein [Phycisphaerales bacterium]